MLAVVAVVHATSQPAMLCPGCGEWSAEIAPIAALDPVLWVLLVGPLLQVQ